MSTAQGELIMQGLQAIFMTALEGPKLLFSFVTAPTETHLLVTTSQPSPLLPA